MSITISNCAEICNNPLNKSTAKMLFSFPKQQRFAKRKQILCDKFYNVKSTSHLRTTSFGFGGKYDFTRDASSSPPPNTYNFQDSFSKSKKKGFGFGKGRDQMEVTGPFVASKKNKNPGPDSYALPSMLQKKSFSFRPKLNTFDTANKNIPGPGSYPVTFGINQKGNYFLAKYKTVVMSRDFAKYTGRCQTSEEKHPGPGSYTVQGVDLSPKGKYVSSRLHNCLTSSFNGSDRKFLGDKSNTPGPGNYRLPSDFGYYESGKKLGSTLQKVHKSSKRSKEDTRSSFGDRQQKVLNDSKRQSKVEDKKQNIEPARQAKSSQIQQQKQ